MKCGKGSVQAASYPYYVVHSPSEIANNRATESEVKVPAVVLTALYDYTVL